MRSTPHDTSARAVAGCSWLYVDCSWKRPGETVPPSPSTSLTALPAILAAHIESRKAELMALPAAARERCFDGLVYAALVAPSGELIDVYESIGRAWSTVRAEIDAAARGAR